MIGQLRSTLSRHWKFLLLVAGLASAALLYRTLGLGTALSVSGISEFKTAILGAGWVGAVVYVLIYVGFVSMGLPNLPFQLAAGAIYGLWMAYGLMYVGVILGAVGAFWLGRGLGRQTIESLAGKKLATINERIERGGFGFLLLLRLIPLVPFNAVNYGSGVSRLRFGTFISATALGSPILTFAHVSLGHAAAGVATTGLESGWTSVALGVSLILVALSLLVARFAATRKLRENDGIAVAIQEGMELNPIEPRFQEVPLDPNQRPQPEIPPTREPHIDIPQPNPPQPPSPTPERPVPVKA